MVHRPYKGKEGPPPAEADPGDLRYRSDDSAARGGRPEGARYAGCLWPSGNGWRWQRKLSDGGALTVEVIGAVALALLLDLLLGDPRWMPHPVRGMGRLIEAGEQ